MEHVKKVAPKLVEPGIKHIATDAFLTKEKYVTGVVSAGLHAVGKLRKDARLRRMYTGPQKARGRRKKFDIGKVNSEENFKDSPIKKIEEESTELRSCNAYSESLKRTIKVVLIRTYSDSGKCGEALLFSTDLALDMLQIYEFYASRFQIEFIFRDAKGFTGLNLLYFFRQIKFEVC